MKPFEWTEHAIGVDENGNEYHVYTYSDGEVLVQLPSITEAQETRELLNMLLEEYNRRRIDRIEFK